MGSGGVGKGSPSKYEKRAEVRKKKQKLRNYEATFFDYFAKIEEEGLGTEDPNAAKNKQIRF